jgi:hypothetical protein
VIYFALAAVLPSDTSAFRITVGESHGFQFSTQVESAEQRSSEDALRALGFENDQQLRDATAEAIVHWTPRAMFVLVPLFAAMTAIAVRRAGRKYPQQLYFALHVHAAWFALLSIGAFARLIPVAAVGTAARVLVVVWMGVYFVLALRRAFGVKLSGALWRAAAIGIAYGVVLVIAMVAIVLPVVVPRQ